jgi:molybdate transport system regulatory protein
LKGFKAAGKNSPLVNDKNKFTYPKLSLQPVFRLWLEGKKRQIILDETDALLLRRISEMGSLTDAARSVGISYRNAWDRVKRIGKNLEESVVETKVGGKTGGRATITPKGVALLKEFRRLRKYIFDALDDREFWEHVGYRLSARNRIKAKILDIQSGGVISEVKMSTKGRNLLTSIISNEAVEYLRLRKEDEVEAIIKATEVIIAKKGR